MLSNLNWGNVVVFASFVLSVLASVAYFFIQHDWRRGLYWALAAGMTALVTWGFK